MLRLRCLVPVVGLTLLIIGGSCTSPDDDSSMTPPNVLVVLADDQGWGDLGFNGNTTVRTPHLDSLALQGATFEHLYAQPVFSPTRAELLTGRYHPRMGSAGEERLDLGTIRHDAGQNPAGATGA